MIGNNDMRMKKVSNEPVPKGIDVWLYYFDNMGFLRKVVGHFDETSGPEDSMDILDHDDKVIGTVEFWNYLENDK